MNSSDACTSTPIPAKAPAAEDAALEAVRRIDAEINLASQRFGLSRVEVLALLMTPITVPNNPTFSV